ncbi:flagellar protein FliT [Pantoea alhagi]|uniref:flagellar protein FliT n=1 Tax=Mixta sp. BE291 TaxID=3158787 RepID=UPI00285BF70A|nr:flagellar protein FliT [Pantoea alhagi]
MTTFLTEEYNEIYKLNQTMLTMAQQGEWDNFVIMTERYIMSLQAVLEQVPDTLSTDEKEQFYRLLITLQSNEEEINRALEGRMIFLRKEISSLHQSNKGNKAYLTQIGSPFQ